MISVGMREDDIFDPPGIDAKFSHAAEDFVLRRIVVERLENYGSLAADNCPRRVNLRSQEIKVVGNLGWFCIPRLPGRRPRGSSRSRSHGRRWNAETKKGAGPLETGRILGGPHQTVDRGGKGLSRCDPDACRSKHCARANDDCK